MLENSVPVIDCIKEKCSTAIIKGKKCYDKGKCALYLDNCNDYIILKGETVRGIVGNLSEKVCDCLILITNNQRITHLVLVEIDDGQNKKPSHAKEQLIGGEEVAKKVIHKVCNYLDENYTVDYIFLYNNMSNYNQKYLTTHKLSIAGKDVHIKKSKHTFRCADN
ncbi:MAG: hypothetical protein HQK96_14760 [Nitrospirae bacterium]|nr:hypothetical protein [Nitrospirota bacterium]